MRSNYDFQGMFRFFLAFRVERIIYSYIYWHWVTNICCFLHFLLFNNYSDKNCIITTIWPLWPEFDLSVDSLTSNIIVRHSMMITYNIWVQVHQLVTLTANYRVVCAITYKLWPTGQNQCNFFLLLVILRVKSFRYIRSVP